METKTKKQLITLYDLGEYLYEKVTYYTEYKEEFLIHIGQEDRDHLKVEHEEIEQYIYNNPHESDFHWEEFVDDIFAEFYQHIDKNVEVIGKNMTWRNLTGTKTFTLENPMDIFHQIAPQTDLTFYIYKLDSNNYEITISHHDSPTGEFYNVTIKE